MKVLSFIKPWKKRVVIDGVKWVFPYQAFQIIEFNNSFIVSFSWSDVEKDLPYEGFYRGCTAWCYKKHNPNVKWVIEEPPEWYDKNGNSEGKLRGYSSEPGYEHQRIDELYMSLSHDHVKNKIYISTTGCREFELDPTNGKVKLVRTGLR